MTVRIPPKDHLFLKDYPFGLTIVAFTVRKTFGP